MRNPWLNFSNRKLERAERHYWMDRIWWRYEQSGSVSLTHDLCKWLSTPHLSTRLLYVGTVRRPELRLVSRGDLGESPDIRYLALSHCWGGDVQFKLETRNLDSMRVGININALSRNFQDAVAISRRIHVSYLWIDSLCILQDSIDDWKAESPVMGQVYANAYCVISATASESSHGGCFRKRNSRSVQWSLMTSATSRYYVTSSSPSNLVPCVEMLFDTRVECAPLSKRAWAFQERLLSDE